MQLVESHLILPNNPFYKEIDNLCFLSKNLYNSCLYAIRQEYINNGINILGDLHHIMKNSEQYMALPAKVSSTVLLTVIKNFKSYFASIREFKKHPNKFKCRPKLPGYLNTTDGRFFISYTNQAISKKIFKKSNKIKLSKTNIEFNTKINDFNLINCIRVVPHSGYYVIEVVYTVKTEEFKLDNNRYASIDLGVNNLATITSNISEIKPYVINGKPLKSINQYYNKKRAELNSILEKRNNKKISNKLNKLTLKRKNKVDNYLHNVSKIIINKLKENDINTLVIGKNDNWKQGVNMNKTNNQNFVNIPHSRFIDMLKYKCEISGINVIITEESYTSKASFLNMDHIPVYSDKYSGGFSGYRYRRGLYKIRGEKTYINADVNGSYNILRKAVPNAFANGIEGVGVHPIDIISIK